VRKRTAALGVMRRSTKVGLELGRRYLSWYCVSKEREFQEDAFNPARVLAHGGLVDFSAPGSHRRLFGIFNCRRRRGRLYGMSGLMLRPQQMVSLV
jgi:hypothetical protein